MVRVTNKIGKRINLYEISSEKQVLLQLEKEYWRVALTAKNCIYTALLKISNAFQEHRATVHNSEAILHQPEQMLCQLILNSKKQPTSTIFHSPLTLTAQGH